MVSVDSFLTLKTDGFSFQVPRQLMVSNSAYFSAALTSGMLEATSGQFHFSNISVGQLSLLAECARLNFAAWPSVSVPGDPNTLSSPVCKLSRMESIWDSENLHATEFGSVLTQAELSLQLKSVIDLVAVADYLQINNLTELCLNQLDHLLGQIETSHCSLETGSEKGDPNLDVPIASSLLPHCLEVSRLSDKRCYNLLLKHILLYPELALSRHCDAQDMSMTVSMADFISFVLSSDRLCAASEVIVLDLILLWLTHLMNASVESASLAHISRGLLASVRPGLLSTEGRKRFLNFWSIHFPSTKWRGIVTFDGMMQLYDHQLHGGTFSNIQLGMSKQVMELYRPRASTPCLLSLIPSTSRDSFEIWLFNLLSGTYHKFVPSSDKLSWFLGNSPISVDFARRVFLCHTNIASTVVIFCHDYISGRLNGFLWCLANCEAQCLPSLVLPPIQTEYISSTMSLSQYCNPLGISSLSNGIFVYCTSVTRGLVRLHASHLDLKTRSWEEFQPTSLAVVPVTVIVHFTPIEQLSRLTTGDWLYAHLETTDRSIQLAADLRRQNLHQSSRVRSIFFRFTPSLGERKFTVQLLPPAPFILRIHKLLTIKSDNSTKEYLFAFGTCYRDQSASQMCFDAASLQWTEWLPLQSSNSATNPAGNVTHRPCASLDPELLGFRGLACVTHLQLTRQDLLTNLYSSNEDTDRPRFTVFDHPSNQLVLIGRPDYRFDLKEKSVSSGIWFHQPHLCFPTREKPCDIPHCEPYMAFALAGSLLQQVGNLSYPALVALVNWDYIVTLADSCRPFAFRGDSANTNLLGSNGKPVVGALPPTSSPVNSSLMSCMYRTVGYSPGDSD